MREDLELRLFHAVVGMILLIPMVVGPTGAFGGLEALAPLFGEHDRIVVGPSLRSSLRAICWMFFALVPLVIWSLRSLRERAGAFRIILACAFVAGLARVAGSVMDGRPGPIPLALMATELLVVPLVFAWHSRLIARP